MIRALADGKFGDKQILRPETAKLMHTRTFGSDERLNGMALGFYEESRNGKASLVTAETPSSFTAIFT
jgi:hypothetical protein